MRLFHALICCTLIFIPAELSAGSAGRHIDTFDIAAEGHHASLFSVFRDAAPVPFLPPYFLWDARYNHQDTSYDEPVDIAVSPDGIIWVTGMVESPASGFDFQTIIYDADGTVLNTMTWDGASHGDDIPADLLLDQEGNGYVVGQTWTSAEEEDIVLAKYDAGGSFLWDATFTGQGGGADIPSALALEATGRVGVTGTTYSGFFQGGFDYVTLIWDSSGALQCELIYNGDLFLGDYGTSLAFDSQGDCAVTGYAIHGFNQYDITTIKYDSFCNEVWETRYDAGIGEGDYGVKVGIDSQDNVIVCGFSRSGTSHRDYLVLKYSAGGGFIWESRYNGPGNHEDYPADMVIDSEDYIHVTGRSRGVDFDYDIATVKFAPNGTHVWSRRFAGFGQLDDEGRSMVLDAAGNVYVTGTVFNAIENNTDIVTLKYDPLGTLEWNRILNGRGHGDDVPAGLAYDESGALYMTGVCYEGVERGYDYRTVRQVP